VNAWGLVSQCHIIPLAWQKLHFTCSYFLISVAWQKCWTHVLRVWTAALHRQEHARWWPAEGDV